jgi:hypothetical protein
MREFMSIDVLEDGRLATRYSDGTVLPWFDPSVADISDAELLRRAVLTARGSYRGGKLPHPRWEAVRDAFLLGSTYAAQLCRRFGFDPDEMIKR